MTRYESDRSTGRTRTPARGATGQGRSGRPATVERVERGEGPTTRSGRPAGGGGSRITPGVVFLAIALIGSAAFAVYAVTVRDASQIPLLAAGTAVLAVVFTALAAYTIRATWRAGTDERNGQALVLGIGGGIAAIIAAGCFAGAIILFLLSQGPPPA